MLKPLAAAILTLLALTPLTAFASTPSATSIGLNYLYSVSIAQGDSRIFECAQSGGNMIQLKGKIEIRTESDATPPPTAVDRMNGTKPVRHILWEFQAPFEREVTGVNTYVHPKWDMWSNGTSHNLSIDIDPHTNAILRAQFETVDSGIFCPYGAFRPKSRIPKG